ncbi:uncharacterized protein LOC131291204 [Anopheles ziemanni]|uniref:uncharacterized protein LOC131291204 n=1 Tax=Anopheles ziemanni TaxID=345580 RepID=UPI00265FB93E|nr:uncharacterized protein LOC131291204 [Anopheles ziemanni]
MLSYMLPVEEKPPSATAAAARNLSLNLTTTTTTGSGGAGAGGVGTGTQPKSSSAEGGTPAVGSTSGAGGGGGGVSGNAPVVTRSIIKPTIKHNASHRYQLISGTGEVGGPSRKQHQPSHQVLLLAGSADSRSRRKPEAAVEGLWDESTNLLVGDPGEAEDDDEDDVNNGNVAKGGSAGAANGGPCRKTHGICNHATSVKLASVLKHTNSGSGSRTAGVASNGTSASTSSSSSNGCGRNGGHTGATGGFYNGYIALSGENDDEQHRLLVSANNLRNSGSGGTLDQQKQQPWGRNGKQPATIGDYDVDDLVLGAEPGTATELLASHSTNSSSSSSSNSNSSTSRAMNSLNGNLTSTGRGDSAEVMDLSESARVSGGDASIGSDSDSVTGGGGGGANTGGKKVKLNKLGGNKNVTLKRVSFGSSKGSMVETLVFETPTPLPEHAEREFFQSPAVLAGAGHTTLYSAGGGSSGSSAAPHHHYPTAHAYHHPHHHQYHVVQQQQQHQQHLPGGYHPLDGGTGIGHHDDSGIELQEEVERSKVRVTFFQSSKPQSISPPESLHLYGAQNLIQFGGTGLGGGYDNNNSPLDSYITSAALNQQYDALPGHQQQLQQYEDFHPDHRDPAMAAVYGATAVPPAGYNRQMSTESGWDNPFRPGGDLSREADEIVNLIKGGKPITPTGDQSLVNGSTPKDSHSTDDPGATVVDGAATKLESSQLQAAQQNGTKSPHKTASGGATESTVVAKNGTNTTAAAGAPGTDGSAAANNTSSTTPISNQVIPGPQSASHVVIDEKKKKKCTCCVIQ